MLGGCEGSEHIKIPITFLIPIALSTWFNGKGYGLLYTFLLPVIRFSFVSFIWRVPWSMMESTVNMIIQILVFIAFSLTIEKVAMENKKLEEEVTLLQGILPICSYCKKIRDEKGTWQPIEHYISQHSDALFSHGLCPDCL
ncbi:MAG: hypothetical protein N3F66_08785 [Spirochaetes bacterium]|nr:hypothetical protein [Spirochaetota bacterium]